MLPVVRLPYVAAELPSYYAMVAVAVLSFVVLGPLFARRLEGLPPLRTSAFLVFLTAGAMLGGVLPRLADVGTASSWHAWTQAPIYCGLDVAGLVVGLVVVTPIATRLSGLAIGRVLDGTVPAIGISVAIIRLGCFLNGCCFGTVCDWPWCVEFPAGSYVRFSQSTAGIISSSATRPLPVHPLELYFALGGLALSLLAWNRAGRRRRTGEVAVAALLFYAAFNGPLTHARGDLSELERWGGLPTIDWSYLAIAAGAAVGLLLLRGTTQPRVVDA